MNIKVRNIFAAVSEKSILDPLLGILKAGQKTRLFSSRTSGLRPGLSDVKFWGTKGTVDYIKSKGFDAKSVVTGFDFDGRVKSLDKMIFSRILADRVKKRHIEELEKLARNTSEVKSGRRRESTLEVNGFAAESIDLVIVDLYPLNKKNFPESMDIGGQALIRAAIKNYKNVAVVFDKRSLASLVDELIRNEGSTTLNFRKAQGQKASRFIAERTKEEAISF